MARVVDADVEALIEVDATISLTPFINAANMLVTKHCADENSAYTVDELTEIEAWLSAHLYTVRDPRTVSEGVKGFSLAYQSKVDLGLATSHYGQMAMLLDWNGGLTAWNKQMVSGGKRGVGITWLGEEADTELTE